MNVADIKARLLDLENTFKEKERKRKKAYSLT